MNVIVRLRSPDTFFLTPFFDTFFSVFGVSWQLPFSNGSYTITSYYSIGEEDEKAILLNKEISK